ncbi:hypothetical protein PFISCL1PPCAC_6359, partial [Pristionchus fissidentatus]
RVLHFGEFCPEEQKICDHDKMTIGLEGVFDLLSKKCRLQTEWRQKESGTYAIDRMLYRCTFCLQKIEGHDHPVGIFCQSNEESGKQKKKDPKAKAKAAFVVHDTCLSIVSINKDKVLATVQKILSIRDNVTIVNKYCMFKRGKECKGCSTPKDERLYLCSDMFCRSSFHITCALKMKDVVIDYYGKTLYCDVHRNVQVRPNEPELRGLSTSQSRLSYDSCPSCYQKVSRWPIRNEVFYVSCCESFFHYSCVVEGLDRLDLKCPRCGDKQFYLSSIQRQGKSLMLYRDRLKAADIDVNTAESDENECQNDGEEKENEEDIEDEYGVIWMDDKVENRWRDSRENKIHLSSARKQRPWKIMKRRRRTE